MTRTTVHRPTSSINHHRAISAVAATGLLGTLLTVTLGSASAMPGRGDPPPAPVPAVHTHTHAHYVAHGCFLTPHTTNAAVIEALPVCFTKVP